MVIENKIKKQGIFWPIFGSIVFFVGLFFTVVLLLSFPG